MNAPGVRTLDLWDLLKRPLTDNNGEPIGRLSDVIVRWRGAEPPLVTGLVAAVAGRDVYVPVEQASAADPAVLRLTTNEIDLRKFDRRHGEVLLRADVLGHRLIDVASARLVKAVDLRLEQRDGDWVLAGVDTRRRPRRIFGSRAVATGLTGGQYFRDWADFEPLIGHAGSALLRRPFGRIRRLKPAQIADLLEEASRAEETEILGQVHADPELEADVFEELHEDLATRLLGARTDADIAAVLARMRADDAADTVAELPQSRRQPVLNLLPVGQRTKVLTLLGFNPASAGGLMGVDFVAVPLQARAQEALNAVAGAAGMQPEALTSVHVLDQGGRLAGVVRLVELVQADQSAPITDIYDDDPVRVGAGTDVADVAVLMSDYNLITVPVVDDRRTMIGIITVDDVLEATLPRDWRRREAAEPPDAHHGDSS
ncbi:MAG TPA: CBS domain-containing protein [Streptosporangiaceae bacterium]|nr:CBS domain-containing protein [Streptosporangiaceae bacterium]